MFERFISHFKDTAKDDIRIFFAPYIGAYRAIKEAVVRPRARNAGEFANNVGSLLCAPFVGAFKGVKAECNRMEHRRQRE